jgi:nucleoside-diphosphate-sugar epimerase
MAGDNFHPEHSHVVPALLRRFHEAALRGDEAVTVWGSGLVRREFMHVDDMAAASVHVMEPDEQQYWQGSDVSFSHINVGTGTDCTVRELAETVAEVTGFRGHTTWDKKSPRRDTPEVAGCLIAHLPRMARDDQPSRRTDPNLRVVCQSSGNWANVKAGGLYDPSRSNQMSDLDRESLLQPFEKV